MVEERVFNLDKEIEGIGIDVGSLYLKVVGVKNGEVVDKVSVFHGKRVIENLKGLLEAFGEKYVGFTGSFFASLEKAPFFDGTKCLIEGVRKYIGKVRYILDVGARSSKLVELDENFKLKNLWTNSVCAAGTGAFFDQQRERLSVSYEEIERWEIPYSQPPAVASRCTVFAKTDLVNRQQEGYSKVEIWAGLCRSMARTVLNSLLRGRNIDGKVVLVGGLSQNKFFVHYLREYLGDNLVVDPNSNFLQALGAVSLADQRFSKAYYLGDLEFLVGKKNGKEVFEKSPHILIERSKYPASEGYVIELDGVEIGIYNWEEGTTLKIYLGIDIGSTSTKCVLMDENLRIIASFYTRTGGEPIKAINRIFQVLSKVKDEKRSEVVVLGVGTTGSGRKLVGEYIGADVIENEITAHAKGALHFFPDAEVIFEIGGQDSKYVRLRNGKVFDCSMNYICSAGTGSFLEEQAKKFGLNIKEVSDKIMGISPPYTQERCSVFMEQDIEDLLSKGFSVEEVMASCTYSVVHNYLNRVVGKKYLPKGKVVFQGATARNKALVGAFEKVLNREIVVSPFCHLMGAIGIAIMAKDWIGKVGVTKFLGFDVSNREVSIYFSTCKYCENLCKITHLSSGERTTSFGYQCGRESDSKGRRRVKEFEIYEKYESIFRDYTKNTGDKSGNCERIVYIPNIFTVYSLLPFYKTFLEELGFDTVVVDVLGRKTLEKGVELASADFCLPVKLAYGITAELTERKGGYIFIPSMLNHPFGEKNKYNHFCPYVQSLPAFLKYVVTRNDQKGAELLIPVFDFSTSNRHLVDQLEEYFKPFGFSKKDIERALSNAIEVQKEFEERMRRLGEEVYSLIQDSSGSYIVLFGRPYIIFSNTLNMNVPLKIANLSVPVIPWMLLRKFGKDNGYCDNMYWYLPREMLRVAEFVKEKENLYPVFLGTFPCGPDSFLLTYLEEVFSKKPFLILELDEYGGDAVFQTRLEAFYNVIKEQRDEKEQREVQNVKVCFTDGSSKDLKLGKVWIPPLQPDGARLFASSLRRFGIDAEALPTTTEKDYKIGRSLTRGSECLPCITTVGTFVNKMSNTTDGKNILFMPTSSGPCRFGQYALLQKIILEKEGFKIPVVSPTCYNGYAGLPYKVRKFLAKALVVYDWLLKCRNRIAPYERVKGEAKRTYTESISYLEKAIEGGEDIFVAFEKCVKRFKEIEKETREKPLIGVVGEIYVRFDPFSNDGLIEVIEECGGEAWVTPFFEWIWYINYFVKRRSKLTMDVIGFLAEGFKGNYYRKIEREVYEIAKEVTGDRLEPEIEEIMSEARKYLPEGFGTEAPIIVGRAIKFKEQGAKLVVNVAPFTCMPGNITTAIFNNISKELGIPIVNVFYDGRKDENERLRTFLKSYF
ncbi:MAG: acyl-CoA dehydratase activase [Brevinematia bacterium]